MSSLMNKGHSLDPDQTKKRYKKTPKCIDVKETTNEKIKESLHGYQTHTYYSMRYKDETMVYFGIMCHFSGDGQ